MRSICLQRSKPNFASSQSGEQGQRDNREEVTRLAVGTCFNQSLPLVPVERTPNVGPRRQHEADAALLHVGLEREPQPMLLQDGPEDAHFKIAGLLGCALTEASLSIRHGRINVDVADEEMSQGGLQVCEPCPFNGVGVGGHG